MRMHTACAGLQPITSTIISIKSAFFLKWLLLQKTRTQLSRSRMKMFYSKPLLERRKHVTPAGFKTFFDRKKRELH